MTLRKSLVAAVALCALLAAGQAVAQTAEASADTAVAASLPAQPVVKPARPTVASLTVELEAANATIIELGARADRQAVALANAQAELKARRDTAVLKDELLVLGRERNAELYKIAQEILAKYADVDVGEALSRREPFVQARRVALENAVQAYEDRLRDSRVLESTLPPSVERRMQEDLARSQDAPAATAAKPADQ